MSESKPRSNLVLAQKIANELVRRGLKIATVESCTGGLLAGLFTSLDGSSIWFDRGFVTYSNQAKHDQVGVQLASIEEYGAVSLEVAKQMAQGGVVNSKAQLAVSITGVAGPAGGSLTKPVGTVYIAVAGQSTAPMAEQFLFKGDRAMVRDQSVTQALHQIFEFMSL